MFDIIPNMGGAWRRTVAVYFPHWPLLAMGETAGCAIVSGEGRVLDASPLAEAAGVRPTQALRVAQALCPECKVLERRHDSEARLLDSLMLAMEKLSPAPGVFPPGEVVFAAQAPARYFGGEASLLSQARLVIGETVSHEASQQACIGIADGVFAARQAARRSLVIPASSTGLFLSDLPLESLLVMGSFGVADLVAVLRRLGIGTLGSLAALPRDSVLSRFGAPGLLAHRLAWGEDAFGPQDHGRTEPLVVVKVTEQPLERAEQVAFIGSQMIEELTAAAAEGNFGIASVGIRVESANGEASERTWHSDSPMDSWEILRRLRWQVEGWLSSPAGPTAGISRIEVRAEQLSAMPAQRGLWGENLEPARRAAASLARVESLVGQGGVLKAVPKGGRTPAEMFEWVEPQAKAPGTHLRDSHPWPGRIPGPMAARVAKKAVEVIVSDESDAVVEVDDRGELRGRPARLVLGNRASGVVAWSRPWLYEERWWEPRPPGRTSRLQLLTEGGIGVLVCFRDGRWFLEAVYE